MNTLRRLVSRYRLYSLILVPVIAFSFIGYKVFNVDATTIPTFKVLPVLRQFGHLWRL
jgi:hypothetical protein